MSINHDRLSDCICKLKILSKLEPREKIIIHERTIEIVDYTTYNIARLKKAINPEKKRGHMIVKLEAMYHDIDSIVDNLINNPPNRTPQQDIRFALDRLRHDLDNSLQGLQNLLTTYNTDKSAVSRLETLYEEVKILSQKINNYFHKLTNTLEVDRKFYGVENAHETSKKLKQINEFDPNKSELQILPLLSVPSPTLLNNEGYADDSFSTESPINSMEERIVDNIDENNGDRDNTNNAENHIEPLTGIVRPNTNKKRRKNRKR